ncbi:ATP phosphoribosyltransferase [Pseudomonadota bacterium]
MTEKNRLKIALQKSGKLHEGSVDMLKKCGLRIFDSKKSLFFKIQELPIDILLVRDDDIPGFVSEGICDLGIIGENLFKETILSSKNKLNVTTLSRLGFSRCNLSIAVPQDTKFNNIKDLKGKTFATSYPFILEKYLKKENVKGEVVKMEGSVEVAPRLKISDVICDIVSTGSTLEANGLKEVATILKSEALLIGQKDKMSEEKRNVTDKLIKRIQGVIKAKESKYVMLNAPKSKLKEITKLLPGSDSPTIMELEDKNYIAVHAVCSEPLFWSTMEELKKAGGTAILVVPIEKMLD